jgi:hypothetical protein
LTAKEGPNLCEVRAKAVSKTLQEQYSAAATESQEKYLARRFRIAPETARVVAGIVFGEVRQ